jgi:hypothetical protein
MRRSRIVGLVMGLVVALWLGMPVALAGSNGQQAIFEDYDQDSVQVCFSGTNQHGSPASGCWGEVSYEAITSGWWWQGTLKMAESNGEHWSTSVPVSQSANYWCFDDQIDRGSAC